LRLWAGINLEGPRIVPEFSVAKGLAVWKPEDGLPEREVTVLSPSIRTFDDSDLNIIIITLIIIIIITTTINNNDNNIKVFFRLKGKTQSQKR
jgi:hypothetical protein